MNDSVDAAVPGAKVLRSDTVSPLLKAQEVALETASKTTASRMQKIVNHIKANPAVPTSVLSIGALAASGWAPFVAGGAAVGMGGYYAGKAAIKSSKIRKGLGETAGLLGKAIKKLEASGASKASIDKLKADRLFVIDLMKTPQEEETKKEP